MKNSALKKPRPGLVSGNSDQDRNSAWKGTWDRPLSVDEKSLDPFTIARMTDHNVRGGETPEAARGTETRSGSSLRVVPTPETPEASAPETGTPVADTPDAGRVNGTQYVPTHGDPDDGGKLTPADAERISSAD